MNYQLIVSLLALSSCVLGQNATATATTTTARALQTPIFTPFTMQSLSNVTRNYYCSQQKKFCKTVCANNVNANTCNVHDATMSFSCLCADGQPPANINPIAYPASYYYCMGNLKSCEIACAGQSQCIVDCREALKCGYQEWDCSGAGPCVKNGTVSSTENSSIRTVNYKATTTVPMISATTTVSNYIATTTAANYIATTTVSNYIATTTATTAATATIAATARDNAAYHVLNPSVMVSIIAGCISYALF